MSKRIKISEPIQTEVLTKSRRRCCICFGLNRDEEIKKGQIAHRDGNPNNNNIDNLAFLCFDHHDDYDSKTSQSKSLTVLSTNHCEKVSTNECENAWNTSMGRE